MSSKSNKAIKRRNKSFQKKLYEYERESKRREDMAEEQRKLGREARMSSKRREDENRTAVVERFLDENVYEAEYERVTDLSLQLSGVDLIYKDTKYIDEKFLISGWNKDSVTFNFELYGENNPDKEGWLWASNSQTTHYNILWFRATDESLENVITYTLLEIPKSSILKYLDDCGVNRALIEKFIFDWESGLAESRGSFPYSCNDTGTTRYLYINENLKLIQNMNSPEHAISACINRTKLMEMCTKLYRKTL